MLDEHSDDTHAMSSEHSSVTVESPAKLVVSAQSPKFLISLVVICGIIAAGSGVLSLVSINNSQTQRLRSSYDACTQRRDFTRSQIEDARNDRTYLQVQIDHKPKLPPDLIKAAQLRIKRSLNTSAQAQKTLENTPSCAIQYADAPQLRGER